MKFFKIFIKLILSLVFGGLVTLFLLQNDPIITKKITNHLRPYVENFFKGNVTFDIKKIQILPIKLTFKNIVTKPTIGDDWSWTCKQLSIGSDWFDFLLYGTVALRIKMDGLNIKTVLNDNGLCVRKHLGFSSGGKSAVVPIFLQSLTIDDCKMQVYEPYTKSLAKAHFFWNMKKIGNALKSTIRFLDGSFVVKKTPVFQNIQGPVRLDIFSNSTSSPLMIRSNCTVDFPHMGTKRSCYFSGSWRYEQGVFSLYNDDRSFVVAPIKLYMVGDTLFSELKSYFPASYLYKLFSGSTLEQELSGQCALTMNVEFEGAPSRVSCSLTSSNVSYKKKSLFSACKISCNRDNAQWHGKTFFSLDPANFFTGTFKWDEALSTGNITLKNQKKSAVPFFKYWNILPNNFSTTIEYDDKSTIKSFYNCVATHKKTEATCCSSGTIEWNNDGLFARGMIDKKKYDGSFLVDPHFCMKHCDFYDEKEKKLFSFNADKKRPEIFSGVVFFPCIKQVAKHFSGHSLQGQGAAKIDGKIQDKKLFMQMQLNDSAIRIPYTYNLINQLCARCNVDFENKIFTVQNVECTLHRGTVECKRLIFNFDENYNLCFAHVPIIFNDCLINWNKDLFAIISGHLTFTKNETSLIKGRFFVDRSQLKKNIFSSDFQQQFFSLPSYAVQDDKTPIELDITIKTKDPVRINTSFLQTSARLDLAFAGTIQKPKPSGKISVFSGDLAFPYKPLHITSGLIDFSSGKLDDPAVEIVAQNKLKKYNVKLAVSGSFQKQDIILESRPSLTQEQILSLLLAGSEQDSLNILMPALLMQNMKGLIFGSDHSPTGVRSMFAKFFKPFERIHLVPSFTDQTGRGGLRGALEIDVSERWRAMIQKNFSLTEDTKVEVEYLLSDDVSLRGVRDERGDISAEVEMRWKF